MCFLHSVKFLHAFQIFQRRHGIFLLIILYYIYIERERENESNQREEFFYFAFLARGRMHDS